MKCLTEKKNRETQLDQKWFFGMVNNMEKLQANRETERERQRAGGRAAGNGRERGRENKVPETDMERVILL